MLTHCWITLPFRFHHWGFHLHRHTASQIGYRTLAAELLQWPREDDLHLDCKEKGCAPQHKRRHIAMTNKATQQQVSVTATTQQSPSGTLPVSSQSIKRLRHVWTRLFLLHRLNKHITMVAGGSISVSRRSTVLWQLGQNFFIFLIRVQFDATLGQDPKSTSAWASFHVYHLADRQRHKDWQRERERDVGKERERWREREGDRRTDRRLKMTSRWIGCYI